jgi:hypothetical protein
VILKAAGYAQFLDLGLAATKRQCVARELVVVEGGECASECDTSRGRSAESRAERIIARE